MHLASLAQREPLELPTPMPIAPPIFTQVSVPSSLTKPGPQAAQELPAPAPFSGSSLPEATGLSGFWLLGGSAAAAGSIATAIARRMFRILFYYRLWAIDASGRT